MQRIRYSIDVLRPDLIDPDTLAEIEADADPRDLTLDARVARWLGGFLSDAEHHLALNLPEGWSVSLYGPEGSH